MLSEAIKNLGLKHVAVMNVHNFSGDYITSFDGPSVGEIPVHPTKNGVVFFRADHILHDVQEEWNLKDAKNAELDYFKALHDTIGLDALVIIDDGVPPNTATSFASAIKACDSSIKTFYIAQRRHMNFLEDLSDDTKLNAVFTQEILPTRFILTPGHADLITYPAGVKTEKLLTHPDIAMPADLDCVTNNHDTKVLLNFLGIDQSALNPVNPYEVKAIYLSACPDLAIPARMAFEYRQRLQRVPTPSLQP